MNIKGVTITIRLDMVIVTLFAVLFFIGHPVAIVAQVPALPPQVKAKLPELIARNTPQKLKILHQEFRNGSGWGQDSLAKPGVWVVYSDRAENPTYTSPDKTKRFGQLDFGEMVCIADIQGDMALVYKDDKAMARYPDIPTTITSKGWIPMDKLLLWNKCPTDQRGIQKKGFIAINLNKMSKDEIFQSKKYSSPENLSKSTALNTNMNFYYVMKETEDGEYALLCNGARINSAQSIYGWVNKNAFVEWNGRVCLEPNWDVRYNINHKGQKVYIYNSPNKESGEILDWREYGQSNGNANPTYQYRMPPNMFRFPLLDIDEEHNYAKCLCFFDNTHSLNKGIEHNSIASSLQKYLGEKGYKNWLQVKAITLFEGYVPLKDNDGNDYWRYILFLSTDELMALILKLRPISEAAKEQNPDRTKYVTAIKTLLKAQLGDSIPDKDIEDMDPNRLEEAIYGIVNVKSENLRFTKFRLGDITNRQKVSDIEYFEILDRFDKKYRKLEKVRASYNFQMDVGGMYYFWIPLEDLP